MPPWRAYSSSGASSGVHHTRHRGGKLFRNRRGCSSTRIDLLPGKLRGEAEYAVIGGVYEVTVTA